MSLHNWWMNATNDGFPRSLRNHISSGGVEKNGEPVVLIFSGKDSLVCRNWCTFTKQHF
jgi:hypothetical protein